MIGRFLPQSIPRPGHGTLRLVVTEWSLAPVFKSGPGQTERVNLKLGGEHNPEALDSEMAAVTVSAAAVRQAHCTLQ